MHSGTVLYLPGESARASLKPDGLCIGIADGGRHLPGESARASLKQGYQWVTSQDERVISRANRPGPH